ncbi:nucleoside recognition GATE domain-containing membrane protein YjiH [Granulicatella balaenopterae]|uniref:Nucleoside recognition GATE domain-containing membrane protein YjiH n=1 Tax=Granulicatella balaenopterae TaxID=137733 RepID=A0A1H9HCR2_9LACT|nr:YjiH family protein [Granulicatella balaenopterae]SEQ60103.1 nucleoside recognition GATE domain-containing membrane protein YjiH [Granulicatella balaenopterae]
MEDSDTGKFSIGKILKFVIPSIIGILLLMTPFKDGSGSTTVAVSVMAKFINQAINAVVPIHYVIIVMIVVSCTISLVYRLFEPEFMRKNSLLKEIGDVSTFWLVIRMLGLLFAVMTALQIGPEIVWADSAGGLILYDLIGGLFSIFLVAGFVLPFLTEFGLLEYIGVFLTKVMRPLFNLPGRSAVDCVASWIGDGTIGVTLTNLQYIEGYYTAREAATIATNFSAVSITFCLVVLGNVDLLDYFGAFYLTIAVAGIIAALIIPRIPPLSKKSNVCAIDNNEENVEVIPKGYTRRQWALTLATEKAEKNMDIKNFMQSGVEMVLGLWLGVIPVIMCVGTLALMLSEHTPIFTYLGMPFVPLLELLQVPDAIAASQTMVVGFADMVVPSILAAEIPSTMTRFIVAALSVSQLIYLSETGAVILGSKLPVNIVELFIIFIERTIIVLPVITIMAHLFF